MAIKIYKANQGRHVRTGTAVAALIVCATLGYFVGWLLQRQLAAAPYKIYVVYGAGAFVGVVLAVVIGVAMNKPRVVDFLVATEGELKKVRWPTTQELVGSTVIVIVTVFLLGLYIFICDYVISGGLSQWKVPFTDINIPGLGLW